MNSSVVPLLSMPEVPSNTCTTARSPSTSSTCPRRTLPSPSRRLTISAYLGFCVGWGVGVGQRKGDEGGGDAMSQVPLA